MATPVLVNDVLMKLHLITDNIYFLGDRKWWRFSYYIINVWELPKIQ